MTPELLTLPVSILWISTDCVEVSCQENWKVEKNKMQSITAGQSTHANNKYWQEREAKNVKHWGLF